MTGIERLRELGGAVSNGVMLYDVTSRDYDEREWLSDKNCGGFLGEIVADIADQIEREHAVADKKEHDAATWVRDHGGLDHVRSEWKSRVPYEKHEQRRQRLIGHVAECEAALGRRNQRIEELGHRVSDLTRENAELRRRAMPEGMEWPRFEDGETWAPGDESVAEFDELCRWNGGTGFTEPAEPYYGVYDHEDGVPYDHAVGGTTYRDADGYVFDERGFR